jgi:3D (Asp-Asp-Asp) domain-containing protein
MITRNQDGTYRNLNVLRKVIKILVYGVLFIYFGMCAKFMLFPTAAHSEKPPTIAQEVPSVLNTAIVIKQGVDPAWGKIKEPRLSDVSAYTSRVQETDNTPCIPADGSNICDRFAKGEKMVASNCYKLGTKLKIGDLGEFTVVDRMNKRYTASCRVDIYMGYDLQKALKHGVKKMFVTEL